MLLSFTYILDVLFLWKEVYLSVGELIDESRAVILQLTEDYI